MKIAVIGTGKMGRIHCRVLKDMGALCGIYDVDQIACHQVAKDFDAFPHKTLDGILKNDLDGVVIATPTEYHLENALRCIDTGFDVLIEKPMCSSLEDAQQLVDVVKKTNRIVTVGYIERHNPVFRELCNRVTSNMFGEITSVNIKRVGGIPRSADNVVMDIMTHDINLLLAMFKKPPNNVYVHRRESGDIVHSAQALLDFDTASATCEANWVSPVKMRTVAVTGTKGYAEIDMIKQEITQVHEEGRDIRVFNEEPLKNEISAFLEAIKTRDTSRIVGIDEAFQTLEVTTKAAYGEEK